jgi:hypothetical protein
MLYRSGELLRHPKAKGGDQAAAPPTENRARLQSSLAWLQSNLAAPNELTAAAPGKIKCSAGH